jgi:integrase
MLVKLTGLHRVKARLAGGRSVTYYYAWRGGPRIDVDPARKRAFAAEFFRLTRSRDSAQATGTMAELVRAYLKSPLFTKRKESTRRGYQAAIDLIEREFFDLPLSAIGEPGARRMFVEWRDGFAETPRKADLLLTVLARILAFGADQEMIAKNPLERVGRLSEGTRRDIIWSDAQMAQFLFTAPSKLRLAMQLARWTGQRQGDLLRLTWGAYDGSHIKLRQGKSGRLVRVRVHTELRTELDRTKREAVTILTPTRRRGGEVTAWTADGFRASWAAACAAAGVSGVTFHDLRGTFVTLAYRNGSSIKEIAEITGHSERDAEAIIRKHYLAGDSVIERLEAGTNRHRKV